MYREVGVSYMASVGAAGVETATPPESPALDFIHLCGWNVMALRYRSTPAVQVLTQFERSKMKRNNELKRARVVL